MFDSEGNVWTGDNFIVGSQAVDFLWNGNMSKFAPTGRALSPAPTSVRDQAAKALAERQPADKANPFLFLEKL